MEKVEKATPTASVKTVAIGEPEIVTCNLERFGLR